MSRHNKFYSALKHGELDDDYDDEDYYEEDYYEEEEYVAPKNKNEKTHSAAKEQSSPPKNEATSSRAPPVASTVHKVDAEGISVDEHDYELIGPLVKQMRPVVGFKVLTVDMVKELREKNYDLYAAVLCFTEKKQAKNSMAKKLVVGESTKEKSGGEHSQGQHMLSPALSGEGSGMSSPSISTAYSPVARDAQQVEEGGKKTMTMIIAGHVDSGKSTILGHTMVQLGNISDREVSKNEREGQQQGKASFKFAWLLDQSEEERRRGVTIDSGVQSFETEHRRVNVLDAPGHKDFVMNMIASATQADVALMVVSSARGEFESGLEHGTREHLTILKTLGVTRILIALNKMDMHQYSKDRYDEVIDLLRKMLQKTKFKEKDVVAFCPISGLTGCNLRTVDKEMMPWYSGKSLLEYIDSSDIQGRVVDAPLRLTVQDVSKTCIYAHVVMGTVTKGENIQFMPSALRVHVKSIDKLSSTLVQSACAGEVIQIHTASDLVGIHAGSVGCPMKDPCGKCVQFEAHIQTFASLESSILPGAELLLAIHSLKLDCKIVKLLAKIDPATGAPKPGLVKCIAKESQAIVVIGVEFPISIEPAEVCRALGRFVLRQKDETVAGGLVRSLLPII